MKDEERNADNVAAFMDYEGQANPKNVEKINYFRRLNEIGFAKRKQMAQGNLAEQDKKIWLGPGMPGGFNLLTHVETLKNIKVADLIEFAH